MERPLFSNEKPNHHLILLHKGTSTFWTELCYKLLFKGLHNWASLAKWDNVHISWYKRSGNDQNMKENEVHTGTFYIKLARSVRKAAPIFFSLLLACISTVSRLFAIRTNGNGTGNKNWGQFSVVTHRITHCNYVTTQQLALYERWKPDFCGLTAGKTHSMRPRPFKGSAVYLWLCLRLAPPWSCFCKHRWFSGSGLSQVTGYSATEPEYYNYIRIACNSALYF